MSVDYKAFVNAYQKSETNIETAINYEKVTGIRISDIYVSQLAKRLRDKGVKLRERQIGKRIAKINIEELNKLCK